MLWGLIITAVLFLLLLVAIKRLDFYHLKGLSRFWLYLALALKVAAACFLFWLYTDYYSNRADADIFKYFDDAVVIYEQPEYDLRSL